MKKQITKIVTMAIACFAIQHAGAQQLQTPTGISGIGNAPSNHIISTGSTTYGGILKIQNTNGAPADKYWIGFSHGTNFNHTTDDYDRARMGVDILGGGAGSLFFTTGYHLAQAERMRIDYLGNVGINTTTPLFRFHVNGSVGFENLGFTNGTNYGSILTRTQSNEIRVGILRDNGTTVSLGNYFSPPSAYMMHLYENSFSGSHTVGIDIELFDKALSGASKGFVCNIQGSQDNFGVDVYTAGGATANGGNFVANNASSTNTGVSTSSQGAGSTTNYGVNSTATGGQYAYGGKFVSSGAYGFNYGVKGEATGGGYAYGGNFKASNSTFENTGLYAEAHDNTGTSNGSNCGLNVTANSYNRDNNYGIKARALAVDGVDYNYGMKVTTEALSSGPINYGVYSEVNSPNNVNYGVYAIIGSNGAGTGLAGSYAGYFNAGMVGATAATNAAFLNGQTFSTVPQTTISDEKFKKDITQVENALDKIMKLSPSTYNYVGRDKFPSFNFVEGKQYGFIAQEIEKVIPEIVVEGVNPAQFDSDGNKIDDEVEFKSVNYDGLIPVLTAAIQEQQQMINELKKQLELYRSEQTTGTGVSVATEGVLLHQNAPNPFTASTEIKYYLPERVQKANILIFDLNGKQLKNYTIDQRGEGSVNLQAGTLAPGMYLYSLTVDGEIADTKRMILQGNQ